MDISTKIAEKTLVASLKGEFDMDSVPAFKEKIITQMEKHGLINLILDLKKVNFIDSSGLGAILGRYRFLKNKGGRVFLLNLKPQVEKIFQLAGMLKLIPVFSDLTEALEEIKEGGISSAQ